MIGELENLFVIFKSPLFTCKSPVYQSCAVLYVNFQSWVLSITLLIELTVLEHMKKKLTFIDLDTMLHSVCVYYVLYGHIVAQLSPSSNSVHIERELFRFCLISLSWC